MKNQVFSFDREVMERAQAEFARICGYEEGDFGLKGIRLGAVVSAFDGGVLNGGEAVFDGVTISCDAFARIDPARVRRVYAYILTAGEISAEGEEDCIYADIWGTAFVNAALAKLLELLTADAGGGDAYALGPGFYGMPPDSLPLIFQIVDGGAIGVEVKEHGYMIPLKSCAGFVIVADDLSALTPADCGGCIGNKGGCRFCRNACF